MYLWLDLSILRLYVILIFFLELFRQCGIFSFSFHLHSMVCIFQNGMYFPAWYFLGWYVLSSMVCIFQHGMYCPEWYGFSSMVCIFQNGMYFPAWYFLAWYVLSSMVCIVQHGMYFPAWYVFSSMVCIFQHGMYCPLYSICYLFIGMRGDNRNFFFKCEIQSFSHGK